MRVAVVGAGSIGSYLAALLSRSGNEVFLLSRGAQLNAVRERGLILKKDEETLECPRLVATDDAQAVGPVDVVISAVKLYDLTSSIRSVKCLIGADTLVVPIQNGVVAHEILSEQIGRSHTAAGTVFISATLERPGVVVSRSAVDRLVFGEISGELSSRARAFEAACTRAGITVDLSNDIVARLWEKFVSIVGINAVCCLARQSVGEVRADERLTACLTRAMVEAVTVAHALKIGVAPDTVDKALQFGKHVAFKTRVSMLEDIEAGKPTEIEWLTGHLVRLAEQLSIDTPINALAYSCLSQYACPTRSPA